MKGFIADANFFLRYLINDLPSQAKEAERHLKQAKQGKITIFVPLIVTFEIIFVLSRVYKFPKTKLLNAIKSLLVAHYLEVENRKTFLATVKVWQEAHIDFVNAYLATLAKESNFQLLTFDKKLKKLLEAISSSIS